MLLGLRMVNMYWSSANTPSTFARKMDASRLISGSLRIFIARRISWPTSDTGAVSSSVPFTYSAVPSSSTS